MRRFFAVIAALFVGVLMGGAPAQAGISITVDKTTQKMTVLVDGQLRHEWPVSTGRSGYGTPTGAFRPQWMTKMHRSRKYHNSPMPHSIFFHGGYAIHATSEVSRLGRPASHGCVRLHPKHAAELYQLVKEQGSSQTAIAIVATPAPVIVKIDRTKRVELAAVDAKGAPQVIKVSKQKQFSATRMARAGKLTSLSAARRASAAPEAPVQVQAHDYARARFENLR